MARYGSAAATTACGTARGQAGGKTVTGCRRPRSWRCCATAAGHLWVATRAGLFSRDASTGAFTRQALPRTSCSERIRAMVEDREGGLWLATDRCGLHRLQDRPLRVFSVADGLPSDNVLAVAAMPDGSVWAGTRGEGIMRWRDSPAGAAPVACAADLACSHCWDFSRGGPGPAAGSVWMVCAPNAVMRWDGQRLARVAPLGGLASVSFAIETSDGSTWMTLGKQVFRRDADGRLSSLDAQGMLEGSRLLHEGRGGTVWIVADDGVAVWRAGDLQIARLPRGRASGRAGERPGGRRGDACGSPPRARGCVGCGTGASLPSGCCPGCPPGGSSSRWRMTTGACG